jgi:hypothetical protein
LDASVTPDRLICSWRVRSALPLPETVPWLGPDRAVDIEIRLGRLPARVGESTPELSYIEAAPDGSLLLDAMPFGRFLVRPDCVVVDSLLPLDSADLRVRLLGPVLGMLCYLRGILPLHACSVRIDTRTIAIAGRSCAGKSTLVAALLRRGHTLITDDICAITYPSASPSVLPSFPALKLARDSLKTLDIGPNGLTHVWLDTDKFLVPVSDGFDPAPSILEKVYLLEDAPEGIADAITAINGVEAFQQLSGMFYRPAIGRLLFTRAALFGMAARLAAHVAVRRLVLSADFGCLDEIARLVEADATDDQPLVRDASNHVVKPCASDMARKGPL